MICYARMPGYIALVDKKGNICWQWQVDDIGVRAATITPRGTILAMLRPPKKDEIDDKPKEHRKILEEIQKDAVVQEVFYAFKLEVIFLFLFFYSSR